MSFDELKNLKSARSFDPLGHEIAGDEAENHIARKLKSIAKGTSFIFKGKRVPRTDSNGRYEIDIIFLTQHHLYVLEVKNYSGKLVKDGENWVQTRRNGEELVYEDIIRKNQLKLNALAHYLKDQNLPTDFIQQRVLFFNDLELAPEIANDDQVITYNQIQSFIPKKSLFKRVEEQFFTALIYFLVKEEEIQSARESVLSKRISSESCKKVGENIDSLRTWDEICLRGGRVMRGDAYTLHINNEEHSLRDIESKSGFSCIWTRNSLIGFYKALKGKPLGSIKSRHKKIDLTPSTDKVKFHRVGALNPEYVYLREIEWFCKG